MLRGVQHYKGDSRALEVDEGVNMKYLRPWNFKLEQSMEVFGEMFTGYFFIQDNVRYVGFASVKAERRGEGHFKRLSERFKEGVDMVVIISPTEPSRELLSRQGYFYDSADHVCVWLRECEDGVRFVPPSYLHYARANDRFRPPQVAVCCKGHEEEEMLFTDPFTNEQHTKHCIVKEIDWLINNMSPEGIHTSGLRVKNRIEQLQSLIEAKPQTFKSLKSLKGIGKHVDPGSVV